MKKILSGLLAACLLLGSITGCNKDLNVQPVDSVDAATALKTPSDVQAALVGCYTGLQNNNSYGGYIQFSSDLLADNGDISFVGTYPQPAEIQRKTVLTSNVEVANIWLTAYSTINRTNNVLTNLDKLDTPEKRTSVEGQAKFIRGLVYFDLVRLFARDWNDGTPSSNTGVPIVLTPTSVISQENQVSRKTVAEVYTQIIADLTDAEAKTPADNGFLANSAAAAAVLSRVYLQQSRFADAAAAADRAISASVAAGGGLNTNYAANFVSGGDVVPNTKEDIFAIQVNAQTQNGNDRLTTFYSQYQRADIEIQDQLLNQFESGDDRLSLFTIDPKKKSPTYSDKYDAQYGNVKLIRLDETYLTRAEGNFRAGTQVGAPPLDDVNMIRSRALLPPLATLTLGNILKERKLELAFEGFRLGDLKRNKESTIDPVKGTVIPWDAPRLILPIPLREINANPSLTQNEYYK